MKNTDDFHYTKEAITCYHQINAEWNTKEETGESLKNALYTLQYAKRHPEAMPNSAMQVCTLSHC